MYREGAFELLQPRTGPVAAAWYRFSLRCTWSSTNRQRPVGLFEVLSTSRKALWARCPQRHFQSKGDGVSHEGGYGAGGISAGFEQCPSVRIPIHCTGLTLSFLNRVPVPFGSLGLHGTGFEGKYGKNNKEREQSRGGREWERKVMNISIFSPFLWLKCIKNGDLQTISKSLTPVPHLTMVQHYPKYIAVLKVSLPHN